MSAAARQPAAFGGVSELLTASRGAAHKIFVGGSEDTRKVLLCLGNEAADLDSIVSAMVLALGCQLGALDQQIPGLSTDYIAVPALSIPADDLALRQDAVYLMDDLSISPDVLLFLPSLDDDVLRSLSEESRLKVVLTDHNKLAGSLSYLAPAVIGVIDHHEDTAVHAAVPYYNVVPTCGSACTLVAQLISQLPNDALFASPQVKTLLSGPILLDTDSLLGPKTSELDVSLSKILGLVKEGSDEATEEAVQRHRTLFEKRISIAALTTAQRLRKDYKQWTHGALSYGIATVPCSLKAWTETHANLEEEIAQDCRTRNLALFLVMLTSKDANKNFQRELLIYSPDMALQEEASSFLSTSTFPSFQQVGVEPSLELSSKEIVSSTPLWKGARVAAWQQLNLKASRKQMQPAVDAFFSQRA